MDKKERKQNGYMTLEASLLMPLAVVVVIFLLHLCFYLYNQCILRQVAYTAALRGSLLKEAGNEEIEAYTTQQVSRLLEDRLLAVKEPKISVEVTLTRVRVKVSMSIHSPLLESFFPGSGIWEFQDEAVAKRLDGVSFIRGIRMLGG